LKIRLKGGDMEFLAILICVPVVFAAVLECFSG